MHNLLEVCEFDSIIGSPDHMDDDRYRHMRPADFNELLRFVRSVPDSTAPEPLDFLHISYKRDLGDVVTVKNYVGLIRLPSGYQIQILPKIYLPEDSNSEGNAIKRVFLNMLRSMKDFPGKTFSNAGLHIERMNLYEIFIQMYLQELQTLVKTGLKSSYVSQEDNLKIFKGKLLTKQNITANAAHAERFYISYDEFTTNCAENRLIKATLQKLRRFTSGNANARTLQNMLDMFDTVKASDCIDLDFTKVRLDRGSERYRNLMAWSKVFLCNKSFTSFDGDTNGAALLFPMEKVYESFVARQIRNALCPDGWDVSSQDTGRYLFTEPRRQFALRPDLVCTRGNSVVVMDTKWKNLVNDEGKNYGISQSDMYQMYAYSKKYNASEVWLLYPLNREMSSHGDIVFRSDDGTAVHIFLIDLVNIDKSMSDLRTILKNKGLF